MGDRCGDNRFEIIKKAKAELLKSTNIETSEDEMKVLDNFLFRCWQMDWLERYDKPRDPLDIPTMTTDFVKEHGFPCPTGYIFKDENGNVINATKIVLEKKKKDVDLTQEQINAMVHDSCVLFCKHCGCGIPRDTCTSLGTCKEHDEYRSAIRTHLMEKKKEYPKTHKEAFDMLGYRCDHIMITNPPKDASQITKQEQRFMLLTIQFQKLLTCRDAYWKIAGEEMGLGKPWKPNWDKCTGEKYCISYVLNTIRHDAVSNSEYNNKILAFPTEEMRDAFYENFKELIESCKELI